MNRDFTRYQVLPSIDALLLSADLPKDGKGGDQQAIGIACRWVFPAHGPERGASLRKSARAEQCSALRFGAHQEQPTKSPDV